MQHRLKKGPIVAFGLAALLSACGAGDARQGTPACTHTPPSGAVDISGESIDPSLFTVVDGDSLRLGDEEIRILGIDAPECISDHFTGSQEPYASQARDFLKEMVAGAKSACIIRLKSRDDYHRTLAYVFLDERNVSAELVREGLAYENLTFYGHQSLEPYAREVMQAAEGAKKPQFEAPHLFRRRNAMRKRE